MVANDLDVFATVGADAVLARTYRVNVTNRELAIDLSSLAANQGVRHPIINAIEILGTVSEENPVTADGLVGHWPLDDARGTIATDASNNGHDGTLTGGISFTSNAINGAVENALDFSGVNDFVSLPNIDGTIDNQFTLSAWINPDDVNSGYQGIAGTDSAKGFMAFVNKGSLAFALRTDDGRKLISHGTIVANRWQHVAVSYNGRSMTWFINGNEVGSEAHTGQVSDGAIGYIGWSGYGEEYFEGGIDDVQLFDNALTEQQIDNLFDEGSQSAALVSVASKARLSLEETDSLTAQDSKASYVHPNPTKGVFKVTGVIEGIKEIMITDFSGRVIMTLTTDADEPELNLSSYPDGVYTVQIAQNETLETLKVVKR